MKIKGKIFVVLGLMLMVCLGLVGCGKKKEEANSNSGVSEATSEGSGFTNQANQDGESGNVKQAGDADEFDTSTETGDSSKGKKGQGKEESDESFDSKKKTTKSGTQKKPAAGQNKGKILVKDPKVQNHYFNFKDLNPERLKEIKELQEKMKGKSAKEVQEEFNKLHEKWNKEKKAAEEKTKQPDQPAAPQQQPAPQQQQAAPAATNNTKPNEVAVNAGPIAAGAPVPVKN